MGRLDGEGGARAGTGEKFPPLSAFYHFKIIKGVLGAFASLRFPRFRKGPKTCFTSKGHCFTQLHLGFTPASLSFSSPSYAIPVTPLHVPVFDFVGDHPCFT